MSSSDAPTEEDTSIDGTPRSVDQETAPPAEGPPKTDENVQAASQMRESKPSATEPLAYRLEGKDYLELWQYFEERADELKDQMFQSVTWVIGFAVGVLGFIFATLADVSGPDFKFKVWWLVAAFCVVGLFLCGYAGLMLHHYAGHIGRNWTRANNFFREIEGIENLVKDLQEKPEPGRKTPETQSGGKTPETPFQKLQKVLQPQLWTAWWRVGFVVIFITVAFVATFFYVLAY